MAERLRATRQPPRRGEPYYDVERGRVRVLPVEGGKAVDYVGPKPGFDARRALRQAGMTGRARGEAGLRKTRETARAGVRALPKGAGVVDTGAIGDFLLYALASIVLLGLLKTMLEGQGPAAVDKTFGFLGGAWQRLFSPEDPLVGRGPASGVEAATQTASAAYKGAAAAVAKLRRLVKLPGNVTTRPSVLLDAGVAPQAVAVAQRFGVKIDSGFRDQAHNREVGGAPNSDHLRGTAADFVGTPTAMRALYDWALKQHFAYVEPWSQTGGNHVHISFVR